jgi:hypothetical protein
MHELTIAPGQKIKISLEHFNPDDIQRMLSDDFSRESLADVWLRSRELEPLSASEILGVTLDDEDSPADILSKVVDALADDPDYSDALSQTRAADEDTETQTYLDGLNGPIDSAIAASNEENLKVEKRCDETSVTYLVNDEPVLQFDPNQLLGDTAEKVGQVFNWIMLVWDSVSFIGSVIGIAVPKPPASSIGKMTALIARRGGTFAKFAWGLRRMKNAAMASEKVRFFIDAFRVGLPLMGILKAVLSAYKSPLKIVWAIAKFAATIALMLVSAGAGFVVKMIQAVANLVMVLADIEKICEAPQAVQP